MSCHKLRCRTSIRYWCRYNAAQAVNTLGQVGQQVANEELKKQQKIQDEKDEYAFNIEASKYGAEYTDAVTETKQN